MLKKYLFAIGIFVIIISLSYTIKKTGFVENRKEVELLYFPSSNMVKPFLMEYAMPYTDYLWFQGIQYYGGHVEDKDFRYADKIFNVLVDIDTKFIKAYTFGALVLLYDLKREKYVFRYLLKGWQRNPDAWEIPYTMAFFNYVYFNNMEKARRFFHLARTLANGPDYLKNMEIFCYQKSGQTDKALSLWRFNYENTENDFIKNVSLRNILVLSAGRILLNSKHPQGMYHLFNDIYLKIGSDSSYIYKGREKMVSNSNRIIKAVFLKWKRR